ncbi:hypothetical protein LL965_14700 [Xanthomonas cassavae CFBP 4642]|uniref:Uncharacterized protein n=1 Tax=Xanthomonas cassavae CFBP 4642 TaxID=1219375 RepID=A0ABS8HGF9_9XANT|nr:hypothetical protein [Xanthomonas cassavae CFBP 4642]
MVFIPLRGCAVSPFAAQLHDYLSVTRCFSTPSRPLNIFRSVSDHRFIQTTILVCA